MSLTQGPTPHLLSIETCHDMLAALKDKCAKLEIIHKTFQADFLKEFGLQDMKQIRDLYPNTELLSAFESAYSYYLTVNSSFTIISFGCDTMLKHLQEDKIANQNSLFHAYQGTCAILANTKLKLERNLGEFLRTHPNIAAQPADESTRVMMRETIEELENAISLLTDAQRLIIEYYELLQHADSVFMQLEKYKDSLDELAVNLRKTKRREMPILLPQKPVLSSDTQTISDSAEPASSDSEAFAKGFEDKGLFDLTGDQLTAMLQAKLTMKDEKPADYFDNWDVLTGSARNSLESPLSPTLLTQYAQAQAEAEVIYAAPSSSVPAPVNDELTRPKV